MVGKKILVVDDSPMELKLMVAPLRAHNYEVITATDGKEAMEKALAEKPDLIVLDVVMPRMDGFQACRKMKASSELQHIPIIFLTSKTQKADEFWGKKQGADVYLTKPIEDSVLLDAVAQTIAKR
jgi:CheY-like chemotaxis protein